MQFPGSAEPAVDVINALRQRRGYKDAWPWPEVEGYVLMLARTRQIDGPTFKLMMKPRYLQEQKEAAGQILSYAAKPR
jgi:hypothetical protein